MSKRKTSMNGFPDASLQVRPVAADSLDLQGKRVVIVGGTDGLGRALARLAAARGASDAARRYPALDVFGLNPGGVKTNIRANYLGAGSLKHRLAELVIGILMPSAETYASSIVPLFVAPELDARSGAMFGKKGQAILPSEGFDTALVERFMRAADRLLASAPK